jgi:hypothetical protein
METELSSVVGRQPSYALHGMGGVGKTQIALKYVYDHLEHFPAIFWVTADSRAKLSQGYVDAAKQLQLEPQDSQRDQETVVQSFKTWLCNTEASWMIVFDNADDLKLLKLFWPPTNRGTIIVTSRNPSCAQMVTASAQVPSMTEEEGISLFFSIFDASQMGFERDAEQENISKLGNLLGELLLDQCGRIIVYALTWDY